MPVAAIAASSQTPGFIRAAVVPQPAILLSDSSGEQADPLGAPANREQL
jgi:hypothetical protein